MKIAVASGPVAARISGSKVVKQNGDSPPAELAKNMGNLWWWSPPCWRMLWQFHMLIKNIITHNHEAHVFFMQILRTASAGSQVSRIDLMDYTFSPAGGERQLVMQAWTIFFPLFRLSRSY